MINVHLSIGSSAPHNFFNDKFQSTGRTFVDILALTSFRTRTILSAGLLLASALVAHADIRNDYIRFRRLSIQQGLSQSSVFSIMQDKSGYMWFATQDGLNRYDGYNFTHFEHIDGDTASLSDNYVNVVFVDRSGTLWAGTRGGGLNCFVPSSENFARYQFNPNDNHSLSNNEIRCIYQDRDGTIWIGTSNGLDRYDPKHDAFTRYLHDPSDPSSIPEGLVECLFEDSRGTLWVGMLGAIARVDRSSGKFSSIKLPVPGILCVWLSEDRDGNLWVAMQNDLYLYRNGVWTPAGKKWHVNEPLVIRRIMRDGADDMWFGGDDGLYRLDYTDVHLDQFKNDPLDPLSLSGNSILSLFQDEEGTIWAGTYDGISKYAPGEFKFRHVKWNSELVRLVGWNKIRSFCEDRSGMIFVATQEGLMTYDRRSNTLKRFPSASWYTSPGSTRMIWSLLEDTLKGKSTLWIGTSGNGLMKLENPGTPRQTFTRYTPRSGDASSISSPSPETLYETRDGTLWIGTLWEGLDRFNRRTGRFTRYVNDQSDKQSLSGNEIWSLCEDSSGDLWVGTAGDGLDMLDPATGRFTRFRHDPADSMSLSDDKVTSIVEDGTGILWIGTYSGLDRFDMHTRKFERFSVRDGLPNNVIYNIVDDQRGNLWLSTNNGLSRFSIKSRTFRNFDEGDGLQSNEFNHGAALRCRDGELLFGGVNGFNIFTPGDLPENGNVPRVVLTDFKIFNRSVRDGALQIDPFNGGSRLSDLELSYKDAVISFDYAALEFTNPDKNQYAYMMVGFDKDWVYAGTRREATYTNLDPGDYTFEVKAANSDGVWSTVPTSIKIKIQPPFWQTWLFRLGLILAFLSIGPIIYFKRVSSLKNKEQVQQEFSRRLIESQEAERKRVAAELHDSIGQDLLVIKNKLLLGLQSGERTDGADKDFHDAVDQVTDSLKHVREISRNLRPIQLDQIGLTAALEYAVESAAESFSLKSDIRIENIDKILSKEGEINFFRIVQESLNNIIKHSNASALSVVVRNDRNHLILEIADNGRGMELHGESSRKGGLGIRSMTERARILGGELTLDSTPGRGTRVILKVPTEIEYHG